MKSNPNPHYSDQDPSSILNTNRAETQAREQQQAAQPAEKPSRRQTLKSVGIIALVIVLLAGIFIGGGVLSERQHQAQLKKEAARAQREDSPVFHDNIEPEFRDGEVMTHVIQAYYSAENGMLVTLRFANGADKNQRINQVEIVLKNEAGKVIAASVSDKIKNCIVPAGDVNQLSVYLPPEAVHIPDDPLDPLTTEITADYTPVS